MYLELVHNRLTFAFGTFESVYQGPASAQETNHVIPFPRCGSLLGMSPFRLSASCQFQEPSGQLPNRVAFLVRGRFWPASGRPGTTGRE